MRSVIIITEKPLDFKNLADVYKRFGLVILQSDARLVAEGSWGRFFFNYEIAMEDEYDESELEELRQRLETLSFAQLAFSDSRAANIAILGLPANEEVMIDNDHGVIAPIREVRRRIQKAEDWISSVY